MCELMRGHAPTVALRGSSMGGSCAIHAAALDHSLAAASWPSAPRPRTGCCVACAPASSPTSRSIARPSKPWLEAIDVYQAVWPARTGHGAAPAPRPRRRADPLHRRRGLYEAAHEPKRLLVLPGGTIARSSTTWRSSRSRGASSRRRRVSGRCRPEGCCRPSRPGPRRSPTRPCRVAYRPAEVGVDPAYGVPDVLGEVLGAAAHATRDRRHPGAARASARTACRGLARTGDLRPGRRGRRERRPAGRRNRWSRAGAGAALAAAAATSGRRSGCYSSRRGAASAAICAGPVIWGRRLVLAHAQAAEAVDDVVAGPTAEAPIRSPHHREHQDRERNRRRWCPDW